MTVRDTTSNREIIVSERDNVETAEREREGERERERVTERQWVLRGITSERESDNECQRERERVTDERDKE